MSKRLVVIDGKSVFYRGYYAMPNLSTKDGRPTGGVYGFAVMALEIVKKLRPDYVCVAWDKRHTNIRSRLKLYPQYKAGRKPAPEDFYEQVDILHELLQALEWPLYELDDYEADDLMATFAKQAGRKGIETYLVTSDLDVLQCVNTHTHIYTLKKGLSNIELFNVAYFEEKYGVGAHQWVDVKALKGDSSDNIPGVGGIGEKTALELIAKYETLDGVYAHMDELKPALQAKLQKDKDMAYLSQKLVTLMDDAPLPLDFDKAKLADGVTPEFVALLKKYEFRTLLRQAEDSLSKEQVAALEAPAEKLELAKEMPFATSDYVTHTPHVVAASPDGLSLWASNKPGEYSIVPLEQANGLLDGPLIGHDLKSTFRAALAVGGTSEGRVHHDTRIAAFLLNSLERSRELTDLLDQPVDTEAPGEVIAAIWKVYDLQVAELANLPTVAKVAHDIDYPSIWLLATVEHRGIQLNGEYLEVMAKEFEKKIGVIERRIYAQAGQEFNISSPAQLGTILYEKLGLPTAGVKKGKTGYSTGAAELIKLKTLHPIAEAILEYREFTKLKSTYLDTLPKLVDADGKLHTTYDLDVAATGRLSSRDPNLQNIPTRTEIGNAIRRAFVPAPGNVFVSADYNQFELRLSAVMANDTELIEDFNKDVDVHTKTAAQVYSVPMDQVDKDMRRRAKVVNFGILYGMSPHGLSAATGMTFVEAKQFIDRYFELRKPIRTYIDTIVEIGRKQGYVETIFGRRRPTPDLTSSNFAVREAAKRAAMNMPIQGTEADLMKLAMLAAEKNLEGLGKQLLQVHDSILVETPKENAEQVGQILKDTMEHIHKLPVKLAVDVKTGPTWGDL
ncbi:MAG TPA: DNA polymerase I [Candidatus Saccharimonadales bacterium]|nr:DNA polymerase I [Candidatus Saccharimonadales bacterium]